MKFLALVCLFLAGWIAGFAPSIAQVQHSLIQAGPEPKKGDCMKMVTDTLAEVIPCPCGTPL